MESEPCTHERGSSKRSAAIACLFMSGANNGGLNSFLTCSHDLDVTEVVEALNAVGAVKAANQLQHIIDGLGASLPATSQANRWARLKECWNDDLDEHDVLTPDADVELAGALQKHVAANEEFYRNLGG
ncbi:MAG: hypothetical protein PHE36_03100 [Novosphingobium sp.]|nr:hypothetical protein [Novosphingobium sp.]